MTIVEIKLRVALTMFVTKNGLCIVNKVGYGVDDVYNFIYLQTCQYEKNIFLNY